MSDTTMDEFIRDNGLSMTAKRVDHNPNMADGENMDHWLCWISNKDGDQWPVFFSMGHGHNGKAPELADILDCVASDGATLCNGGDFEGWCGELGFDSDSIKALNTYKACEKQNVAAQDFLGMSAYETLLWDTERL